MQTPEAVVTIRRPPLSGCRDQPARDAAAPGSLHSVRAADVRGGHGRPVPAIARRPRALPRGPNPARGGGAGYRAAGFDQPDSAQPI